MQKILRTIKRELLEIIPPTIFFFVAFNVITFTKGLMLEQYGIKFSGFVTATVGALIVAKVVLIADRIPFINKYPDKPLIYNVVWKTGDLRSGRSGRQVPGIPYSPLVAVSGLEPGRRASLG